MTTEYDEKPSAQGVEIFKRFTYIQERFEM